MGVGDAVVVFVDASSDVKRLQESAASAVETWVLSRTSEGDSSEIISRRI